MLLLDAATVEGTRITAAGYLVASAKLARSGVYQYRGDEVGRPDLSIVRIYRPITEVFGTKALRSFANAPVTINHPVDAVSSSTWRRDAVGTVGEEVGRDGEFVTATIRVQDADAIRKIQSGTSELSCGYTSSIEWTPGVTPDGQSYDAVMGGIRGNHVAICARGRAGSHCRIGA
jgi:hypothetical protein